MEKVTSVVLNLSQSEVDFLKSIALEYDCSSDNIEDIVKAIISHKMEERSFLLSEIVKQKFIQMENNPNGVEFTIEEAKFAGIFKENAIREEDI